MTFTIELPNGDWASAETFEALQLAAETLLEDAAREMRENLIVKKNGRFDSQATSMLQQEGMLC